MGKRERRRARERGDRKNPGESLAEFDKRRFTINKPRRRLLRKRAA